MQGRLKQLNAPFGQFGHDAEIVSTTAVVGDDRTYNGFALQLAAAAPSATPSLRASRASSDEAVFHGGSLSDTQLSAARRPARMR